MGIKQPVTQGGMKRSVNKCLAHYRARYSEVFVLIERLQKLGKVALFGGALRDWFLEGPKSNPRDIDLVIDTAETVKLAAMMAEVSAARNKFGGFRLTVGGCPIDVWPVTATWAFRLGHVPGSGFSDLPQTTFLNADAIVYDLTDKQLYCDSTYGEFMKERVLDVNLEPNPNPAGCIARTLRMTSKHRFRVAPKLVKYMALQYEQCTVFDLSEAILSVFDQPIYFYEAMDILRSLERTSGGFSDLILELSETSVDIEYPLFDCSFEASIEKNLLEGQ